MHALRALEAKAVELDADAKKACGDSDTLFSEWQRRLGRAEGVRIAIGIIKERNHQ